MDALREAGAGIRGDIEQRGIGAAAEPLRPAHAALR